jgi:hypothetical protein
VKTLSWDEAAKVALQRAVRAQAGASIEGELSAYLSEIDDVLVKVGDRAGYLEGLRGRLKMQLSNFETPEPKLPRKHETPGFDSWRSFMHGAIEGLSKRM